MCSTFYVSESPFHTIDWILIKEDRECDSEEITKYGTKSIQECADACKGLSSMFVFDNICSAICGCYCEIGANPNGTCSVKIAHFYNLYKYSRGKHSTIQKEEKNLFKNLIPLQNRLKLLSITFYKVFTAPTAQTPIASSESTLPPRTKGNSVGCRKYYR